MNTLRLGIFALSAFFLFSYTSLLGQSQISNLDFGSESKNVYRLAQASDNAVCMGWNRMEGLAGNYLSDGFLSRSGELYAGGNLHSYGQTSGPVVKWNGQSWEWSPGLENLFRAEVFALGEDSDGKVYASLQYDGPFGGHVYDLFKLEDGTWVGMDLMPTGQIYDFEFDSNGILYVVGRFTEINGVAANYVAKWDGSTWSPLSKELEGTVTNLAIDSRDRLVVAGWFDNFDGERIGGIARWDGSNWENFDGGVDVNGRATALAVDSEDRIVVGGRFVKVGEVWANNIARWDGNSWSNFHTGLEPHFLEVNTIAFDTSNRLYVGGNFDTASHRLVDGFATWNEEENEWRPVLAGSWSRTVNSLVPASDGGMYVLINFGDMAFKWAEIESEAVPEPFSDGSLEDSYSKFDGEVVKLVEGINGDIFAYGDYSRNGSVSTGYLARWDGTTWHAVRGVSSFTDINDLVVDHSGNLFVGGQFRSVGGIEAFNVARWDGSTWSAVGEGLDGYVYSLGIDNNGQLYAGGRFPSGGLNIPNNIAVWDGSLWVSPGNGVQGTVTSIDFDLDNNLIVNGALNDGSDTSGLAIWDGSAWSSLGDPSEVFVSAYNQDSVVMDDQGILYAQVTIDDTTRTAKWENGTWVHLPSSQWSADRLFSKNGSIYSTRAAHFSDFGTKSRLAKLVDGIWYPANMKLNGHIKTMVISDNHGILLGGNFTYACDKSMQYFARWVESETQVSIEDLSFIHPDKLVAYPNPVTDSYTIELDGLGDEVEISIYDTLGREMRTLKTQSNERVHLSLAEFSPGVYFVEARTKFGSKRQSSFVK